MHIRQNETKYNTMQFFLLVFSKMLFAAETCLLTVVYLVVKRLNFILKEVNEKVKRMAISLGEIANLW